MHSTKRILWAIFLLIPFLLGTDVSADEIDDTPPDVTARVARISFIRGDVQVRRDGSQDWEKAVLNLPVVEGDEITTGADARFEIQFNAYIHVRVAENSGERTLQVVNDERRQLGLTFLHVQQLLMGALQLGLSPL